MENETLNAFDKGYRSFSPSTEIPLDRINNESTSLKKRQPDTVSYEMVTRDNGANIEAEDTTEGGEKNSISELLLERREKNPPKIISSFNFELIQFEGHGMKHAELTIISTKDKNYCYHYSWQNNRNLFLCYGCKHISISKSISAKLINDDNGNSWIEMSDVQHECIPVLYKPYIKEEKIVKKENYEIFESLNYKGEIGSELYIFENFERLLCRKHAYYSKIKNYICGKCLSKGVRVIALVCKNNVNGEEYIQHGINDHVCLPVSYSSVIRKQKAYKPINPNLKPSPMQQNATQSVVNNNFIENQYHNCQMNNLECGGINSNKLCCTINNQQWNGSSTSMATSLPNNNNNEFLRNMSSNNCFHYGTTNNHFGNNTLPRNYPPNFNNINYYQNHENSFFVQTQNEMSNQASIFQPNQAFAINNNAIYNYPSTEISSNMQYFQSPYHPLLAMTNEMQKEKPFQIQILPNQSGIDNAININPSTEISNAPEFEVCNNPFSTSKIETPSQAATFKNQESSSNNVNMVKPAKEFSNAHDFEIRYQCMPPSNIDKYTLIVSSSAAKNQCYKLYFNKDHGIFICGKCLKRNQPTFVELCQNKSTGKYYLKFCGKPHICKLSNYPPINLAGDERLLERKEYQPMVKKEILQTPTRNQNISKSASKKSSELEINATNFSYQPLSDNVPQNKNRIITSENFKFGPNTIGTPNAKIEVSIEDRLYYYYQQNLGSRYLCTKCSNKKVNVTATMNKNEATNEIYFVLNDLEHVCQ